MFRVTNKYIIENWLEIVSVINTKWPHINSSICQYFSKLPDQWVGLGFLFRTLWVIHFHQMLRFGSHFTLVYTGFFFFFLEFLIPYFFPIDRKGICLPLFIINHDHLNHKICVMVSILFLRIFVIELTDFGSNLYQFNL